MVAYLLQILVVVISLHIKLGANKQITQLALYSIISPEQKLFFLKEMFQKQKASFTSFWRRENKLVFFAEKWLSSLPKNDNTSYYTF